MILQQLINVLKFILIAAAALLPDYTPPPAADLSAFQVIGWLVPIGEIVTLAAVIVAYVSVTLGYTLVNWVVNKVRGSG